MDRLKNRLIEKKGEWSLSILVNKDTKVIVQGITGLAARFHTKQMLDYGTKIVGGTSPGKGGWKSKAFRCSTLSGKQSMRPERRHRSYVPAPFAADAILEAVEAELDLVVCITEHIPVLDMVGKRYVKERNKTNWTKLSGNYHR